MTEKKSVSHIMVHITDSAIIVEIKPSQAQRSKTLNIFNNVFLALEEL